jgi:phage terminase small subunit
MPRAKKDPDFDTLLEALESDKQRLFCREYLTDLIATRAAIRAGYSENSAHVTACRMLKQPKIAAAIAQGLKELGEAAHITREWVLEKLKQTHAMALDEGNTYGAIRALSILAKSLGMLDKDLNVNVDHSGLAQVVLHYPDNKRGPKR